MQAPLFFREKKEPLGWLIPHLIFGGKGWKRRRLWKMAPLFFFSVCNESPKAIILLFPFRRENRRGAFTVIGGPFSSSSWQKTQQLIPAGWIFPFPEKQSIRPGDNSLSFCNKSVKFGFRGEWVTTGLLKTGPEKNSWLPPDFFFFPRVYHLSTRNEREKWPLYHSENIFTAPTWKHNKAFFCF